MRTTAYTDGACSGNPGPGGWAWVVPDGAFASGAAAETTNQRMELQATLEAVRTLKGSLLIVSDSTYVVNCFRDSWWRGWLQRGWKNSAKKPVANRDLWEPLIELYQQRDVQFEWVKGHSGDKWNDVADRLAVEATKAQVGRSGDGPPDALGPADAPDTPAASETPDAAVAIPASPGVGGQDVPAGHLLVVGGHRPPEIGGYDANPLAERLRTRLQQVIEAKSRMHEDLVVLSGLQLGAEQLGVEAAMAAGVPHVAVLAFPDQAKVWPAASRKRFDGLVAAASQVVLLQKDVPETKAKVGAALRRRDGWLARAGTEALVVWNGKDRFVRSFVQSLEATMADDVWVVDPGEV